jgi:hypothetical protein
MPKAVSILFGAGFTVCTCWAAGRLLLRRLALPFHPAEGHLLAFVAGSACWSLVVFCLAAVGLAHEAVFLAAGTLVIAGALWVERKGCLRPAEPLTGLPRFWKALFALVFATYAALYFLNALAPEASPDGSSYHLGLVARYLREHGFHRITTSMYASLSQGLEMLFLFAFAFGRHSAAALLHFAFLLTLPLAMLSYARRFGFPAAGVAGALFVLASPLVGVDGSSAYNDVAVACVLFTLFYLLQIWDADRQPAWLVLIGLVAGFAYAIKYTACLGVPYALGFVGWKLWRARRPFLRPLAIVAVCALLMMAPWMLKNWIWVGNPVSPFFNRLFPNPYVHISLEEAYFQRLRNYDGLTSYWAVPIEATVRGGVLHGFLGPLFLLAPLALLALRSPSGRRLVFASLVFGATYLGNLGTRFLIPALPCLSLAMALGLMNLRGALPVLVMAHALASWPGIMSLYCNPYAWRIQDAPIAAALRRTPEEAYLLERLPSYAAARLLEARVPPGGRVFSFGGPAQAYTSREVLVGYEAALNNLLGDILWTPVTREYQPVWRLEFPFAAQTLRRLRVVQTAGPLPGEWSVSELRVFLGGQECARAPQWRLRAHPNPWEVQLAFDNTPITRWRSWQSVFPGMYLEVDFGGALQADSVVLECTPDQWYTRPKVEAQLASGHWKTLAENFQLVETPAPPRLRRAAAEELKARGVDYLLVEDSALASDLRARSRAWGVTLLGSADKARLYRLD